jgi:hypothetical protein
MGWIGLADDILARSTAGTRFAQWIGMILSVHLAQYTVRTSQLDEYGPMANQNFAGKAGGEANRSG